VTLEFDEIKGLKIGAIYMLTKTASNEGRSVEVGTSYSTDKTTGGPAG
jgi:hypothetical protein